MSCSSDILQLYLQEKHAFSQCYYHGIIVSYLIIFLSIGDGICRSKAEFDRVACLHRVELNGGNGTHPREALVLFERVSLFGHFDLLSKNFHGGNIFIPTF